MMSSIKLIGQYIPYDKKTFRISNHGCTRKYLVCSANSEEHTDFGVDIEIPLLTKLPRPRNTIIL